MPAAKLAVFGLDFGGRNHLPWSGHKYRFAPVPQMAGPPVHLAWLRALACTAVNVPWQGATLSKRTYVKLLFLISTILVSVAMNSCTGVASVASNSRSLSSVAHSVSLTWNASPSPTASGYNVYRSTVSGGGYVKMNSSPVASLSYVDTTVSGGLIYYYVTTAVDPNGDESASSNETQAIVP